MVNNEQTTDELNMTIFLLITMQPFRQRINCHIDHTNTKFIPIL